jgi:hypothetical protein
MNIQPYSVWIPYGNQTLSFGTGGIARQGRASLSRTELMEPAAAADAQ